MRIRPLECETGVRPPIGRLNEQVRDAGVGDAYVLLRVPVTPNRGIFHKLADGKVQTGRASMPRGRCWPEHNLAAKVAVPGRQIAELSNDRFCKRARFFFGGSFSCNRAHTIS